MKNLKVFGLFLIVSLFSFTFASCEKEDKAGKSDNELTAKDIEGFWFRESPDEVEYWGFEDGEFEHEGESSEYGGEFDKNGIYTVSNGKLKLEYEDGTKESLSISLDDDILTIDGKEYEPYEYSIVVPNPDKPDTDTTTVSN